MTNKNEPIATFFLFLLALFIGLLFTTSPGTSDMDIWRSWTKNADALGLVEGFRANQADYPPAATAILLGGYRLFDFLKFDLFESIKLTILVFLLLTTVLFWLWTRDGTVTLILYASLLLNSVALGYIDIFFAPSFVLALWMLKSRRWAWFSVFYAISCLTKWQPLLLAPFLALYIIGFPKRQQWQEINLKPLLFATLPGAVLIAIVIWVFQPGPLWQMIQASVGVDYLSGNALNFNWIITHYLHVLNPEEYGDVSITIANLITTSDPKIIFLPRLLFYFTFLATLITFIFEEKTFRNLLVFTICGFFAYFTFNTGVHENHLFPVMILVGALLQEERRTWKTGLVLILIHNLNMFLFYGVDGIIHFPRPMNGVDIALVLALFNLAFFIFVFIKIIYRFLPGMRNKAALNISNFA